MAVSKTIIAVVAVAVIVVVAVGAYFALNGGGESSKGDTYYFYVNYGDDNVDTKWYSGVGTNADEALANAVKGTSITVTYSYGYPNFDDGTWGIFNYNWSVCNATTATESVSGAFYQVSDWGTYFQKSNGWDSFSGYGDDEKKVYQAISKVFYFSKYDAAYNIDDPVEDQLWATGSGDNPFTKGVTFETEQTYYFYVDLGDNNTKTKWYSAKAKNADDALAAALKDSGIELTYSSYGYPNFDGQSGGMFSYDWSVKTAAAADASTSGAIYQESSWGTYFQKSNGWDSFAGYGSEAKKVYQSNANIFIFTMYDASYDVADPTESLLWQTAGGDNPFKA